MVVAAARRNNRKRRVLSVRARGGKAVMKAARSRIAAIGMLAAGTAVVLGQLQPTDRANAADPVRERAEDLAQAASRRFSEVMKDGLGARAQGTQPAASRSEQAGAREGPWTAALEWLERSNHEYKSLVRRLSQASGPAAGQPTSPAGAPAAKPEPQPAPGAGMSEPKEDAGTAGWLTWSSERFQEIMRKLAEGAAPPKEPEPPAKKTAAESSPPTKTQPEKGPEKQAAVTKHTPLVPPR